MFTNEWTQKTRMLFYRALLCGLLVVMPFCTMYSVVCKSEKAYLFNFLEASEGLAAFICGRAYTYSFPVSALNT